MTQQTTSYIGETDEAAEVLWPESNPAHVRVRARERERADVPGLTPWGDGGGSVTCLWLLL